jgi:1-acyl-sn-glycerol-3-phosphate acyltransferase
MAELERREPLKASPRGIKLTQWSRRIVVPPLRFYFARTKFKLVEEGRENVPASGPCLVLCNHVGFHDPVMLIFSSGRTIHFLTSQATMTDAGLATVMRMFGAVPKQKGVADPKAIRGLQAWAKVGGAVGLFPEGERTWDGSQLPLLPGIERLVRLLKIPVVCAKIENADLVMPRWGHHPRRGNIRVSYGERREFERKTNPAEIRAWIEEGLRVDPGNCWRSPVRGKKLARGLSNLLYMCPVCEDVGGLAETDDELNCRSCGRSWRIDPDNTIYADSTRTALWELAPDLDRKIEAKIDTLLDADPNAEVLRSEEPVEAIRLGDEVQSLATGTLVLDPKRIALLNPTGGARWEVEMDQVVTMTIELARRLQIYLKGGELIEMRIPRESVVKYRRAFDHMRARASRSDRDETRQEAG